MKRSSPSRGQEGPGGTGGRTAPRERGDPGGSPPGSYSILAAYRDGVTVICELAAQFTDTAWLAATPCTKWRTADLAGHLRCVADDYYEYLDDAPASRLARLMASGLPALHSPASWPGRTRPNSRSCRTCGGLPQLWPEFPARSDSDDPWHYLLAACGRDPGWTQR